MPFQLILARQYRILILIDLFRLYPPEGCHVPTGLQVPRIKIDGCRGELRAFIFPLEQETSEYYIYELTSHTI
jgi:hypothetical protein